MPLESHLSVIRKIVKNFLRVSLRVDERVPSAIRLWGWKVGRMDGYMP